MHALLLHLESVATTHAQRVALIADGQELSFADLWSRAHDIAHYLRSGGIGAGDRVAVVGDRGVQDFVHMLGAWLAGAAYVPIGTRVPAVTSGPSPWFMKAQPWLRTKDWPT